MIYSPCPLYEAANRYGMEVAIISGSGHTVSYNELNTIVECAKEALIARGLKAGDSVGLHMSNSLEQISILIALFRLKVLACPLSEKLPLAVAASYLRRLNGSLLICKSEEATGPTAVPILKLSKLGLQVPGQFIEDSEPTVQLDTMATVIFTSGSSGEPKAVVHSLNNHIYSALGANVNINLECGDRYILSLPVCHVAGLAILFRCLKAGATIVIPDENEDLLQALQDYAISHVSMVVPQLYRLLQTQEFDQDSLKAILLGGSAIPASLVQRAIGKGLPVYLSYGSSETASQAVATSRLTAHNDLRSSGKVLPYREVTISSKNEVLVRGKTLFLGYSVNGILSRPVDEEGWFATGDLGEIDESGNLFILGRRDNMFISGGENIYPEEVEKVLCELNEIQQAVVVPVSDAEFGQKAVAFLKFGEVKIDIRDLKEKLLRLMPSYKVPRYFFEWPEAADNGEMKIDRNLFKSFAEQEITRNSQAATQ